jgi:5-hydroxyisourate hydrolase-like protein (transthyretin family)
VVSATLALDTGAVPVGSHTLKVVVSDAAGNETVAGPRTFTVTRDPVAGPNGNGATRSAKLSARLAGARKGVRALGFTTQPRLSGRLVDEHATAITGAVVEILARQRRAGGQTRRIASATTGADGRFRVTLPSGPSRTLTITYTAFGADPKPTATVRTRTAVRASVTGSISPRSPRPQRPLRLSGRLRNLPRGGVLVAVQARQRGVWRTVDTVETRDDGRYSWPYRFQRGQAGRTFFFRARVKSPNYPFDPGATKPIRVRVRR